MTRYPARFRPHSTLPLGFLAASAMLICLIGYFAWLSGGMPGVLVLAAIAVLSLVMLVFGISPLVARHEVHQNRIILRQGWYFTLVVPMRHILRAEGYSSRNYGLGMSYSRPMRRLSILTADKEKVSIIFRDDILVRVLGIKRVVREIVVNVTEPDVFIKTVNDAGKKGGDSLEFRNTRGKRGLD